MSVPTHFYKVVLSESKSRLPFTSPKVAVGAFVMPNDQIQPDMPLTAFAVPLEMLEDAAGTVFVTAPHLKHSRSWLPAFSESHVNPQIRLTAKSYMVKLSTQAVCA